jgi:hypothetical protein
MIYPLPDSQYKISAGYCFTQFHGKHTFANKESSPSHGKENFVQPRRLVASNNNKPVFAPAVSTYHPLPDSQYKISLGYCLTQFHWKHILANKESSRSCGKENFVQP